MSNLAFLIKAPAKVLMFGEVAEEFGKRGIAATMNLKTELTLSMPQDVKDNEIGLRLDNVGIDFVFCIEHITKYLMKDPLPLTESNINHINLEEPLLIDGYELLRRVEKFMRVGKRRLRFSNKQQNSVLPFLVLLTGMFSCVSVPLEKCLIQVASEIRLGGLGSSASFSVCLSAALFHIIRSRVQLNHEISRAGYKSLKAWCQDFDNFDDREKRIICRWACLNNRVFGRDMSDVGPTICTFGTIIQYKKHNNHITEMKVLPEPKMLKILLVYTGVQREILSEISKRKKALPYIVDCILRAIDELSIRTSQILCCLGRAQLSEKNAKSPMLEVLMHQIYQLGELADLNQLLLKALGVSCPELNAFFRLAKAYDFHGKMTGYYGTYGYILLTPLVDRTKLALFKKELLRQSFTYSEVRIGVPGVMLTNCI